MYGYYGTPIVGARGLLVFYDWVFSWSLETAGVQHHLPPPNFNDAPTKQRHHHWCEATTQHHHPHAQPTTARAPICSRASLLPLLLYHLPCVSSGFLSSSSRVRTSSSPLPALLPSSSSVLSPHLRVCSNHPPTHTHTSSPIISSIPIVR
ncbi:hypothetical protein EX30DRAFT_230902 [Ascodesmis nigricans]|uniref:Uncharacterized protein n=1 Tax=Ascodesmis nigricans TaxID=341454 RepID=A0A4S2MIX2_9PEZI|nr:hypothetical protein EX30DRAFT_230902 [Ascodesmis nigricans]